MKHCERAGSVYQNYLTTHGESVVKGLLETLLRNHSKNMTFLKFSFMDSLWKEGVIVPHGHHSAHS